MWRIESEEDYIIKSVKCLAASHGDSEVGNVYGATKDGHRVRLRRSRSG